MLYTCFSDRSPQSLAVRSDARTLWVQWYHKTIYTLQVLGGIAISHQYATPTLILRGWPSIFPDARVRERKESSCFVAGVLPGE